jgi:hypothetical protein
MFCPVRRAPLDENLPDADLRSINQISLRLVHFKFNGRNADRRAGGQISEGVPMQARQTGSRRAVVHGDLLPPEPMRRRPETMSARPAIEDAVFEVVGPADFRLRQSNDNPPPARDVGKTMTPMAGQLAMAVLGALERGVNRLSPQSFATLSAGLFLAAFWAFGGFAALGAPGVGAKQSSPFSVSDVFTDVQDANGMKLAVIGGTVTNLTASRQNAPRLLVKSVSGSQLGLIDPAIAVLEPGQSLNFAGRIRIPGGKSTGMMIIPEQQ